MSGSTLITTIALSAWFVTAALAGAEGWLVKLPRPVLMGIAPALGALALLAVCSLEPVRRLAWSLPLRLIVALHVTRIVGVYFLIMHARMQIPGVFAIPAGWGEILVAVAALGAALAPLHGDRWLKLARWWNVVGLAELSLAFIGGTILAFSAPDRAMAFARPPLSLHLTFLTPLAIVFHCILLSRLRPGGQGSAADRTSG